MGAYSSYIAGLNHRPNSTRKALADARPNDELIPHRDPKNDHDENAILLEWRGLFIGYVPARHAQWFAERLDSRRFATAYVVDVEVEGWFAKSAKHVNILLVTSMRDAPDGTEAARLADEEDRKSLAEAEARRRETMIVDELRAYVADVIALLRWIGRISDGPSDEKEDVIDACLRGVLQSHGFDATEGLIAKLKRPSNALKGSEKRAMTAIESIVAEKNLVPIVSKSALDMIKIDGSVSKEEELVFRKFLKSAREVLARTRSV